MLSFALKTGEKIKKMFSNAPFLHSLTVSTLCINIHVSFNQRFCDLRYNPCSCDFWTNFTLIWNPTVWSWFREFWLFEVMKQQNLKSFTKIPENILNYLLTWRLQKWRDRCQKCLDLDVWPIVECAKVACLLRTSNERSTTPASANFTWGRFSIVARCSAVFPKRSFSLTFSANNFPDSECSKKRHGTFPLGLISRS